MKKTFKYRVFPSNKQAKVMEQTLDGCRWFYNYLLEQRKNAWENEKKSLSRYDQSNGLKSLKEDHDFLKNVHSQVLQNVSMRVDLAFRSFFRRVKTGEKPGYPRFQGKFRYDSFCYPQSGFKLLKNVVQLSKIGGVKIKLHRPIEGSIKTCTVKRSPTGKWYVSFSCNIEREIVKHPTEPSIGIDMGLEHFATFSNGNQIDNPRFFRKEEKVLVKAQRKFSAKENETKEKSKARKVVSRIHERIRWKRENFVHQESRKIINSFNTIVVEDLAINNMQKNNFRGINKSIGDVAWRMFLNTLTCKAEEAGKSVIKVNPAYTSQICSRCGNRKKLKLSERIYHCPCCDLSLNRDVNAALNILALGTQDIVST